MFIPVGYLYAIIPVLAAGMIGFVTWLVSTSGKHAELLATIATKLETHDGRLDRLEGWQDGLRLGRATAVEEARGK